MDQETAKALKVALEMAMTALDVPVKLAADADDANLRRMIGALASEVVSKIDYEILPYLYAKYPELKPED